MEVPQKWEFYLKEILLKWMIWGYPHFRKPPIYDFLDGFPGWFPQCGLSISAWPHGPIEVAPFVRIWRLYSRQAMGFWMILTWQRPQNWRAGTQKSIFVIYFFRRFTLPRHVSSSILNVVCESEQNTLHLALSVSRGTADFFRILIARKLAAMPEFYALGLNELIQSVGQAVW